jgi:hypothetical protein
MAMPTGRSDKQITKEMAVELVRPDASHPGDPMLLSSPESDFRTETRVVHCQQMENNRFAVGRELLA